MSLQLAAQHLASKGRGPDTQLVHMAPGEIAGLNALAKAHGGALTINPDTGLPEAGFLSSILPMLAGAALTATGVGAPLAAALVGGASTLATGSLSKGLMAGLGAFGGYGIGEGLGAAAGAANQTAANVAGSGIDITSATPTAVPTSVPDFSIASAVPTTPPSALGFQQSGSLGLAAPAPAAQASAVQAATPPPSGIGAIPDGIKALATPEGRTAFLGQAATKTAEATGVGGYGGLAKYGLAALAPVGAAMQPRAAQYDGGGENPYRYRFSWERPYGPNTGGSSEALQLRGNYTRMAGGGQVGAMSATNQAIAMMANGGQGYAEGGDLDDPARGMSGASADAMRYLMGQSPTSPRTVAAQQMLAQQAANAAGTQAAAPADNTPIKAVLSGKTSAPAPRYTWDQATQTYTRLPDPVVTAKAPVASQVYEGGGYSGYSGYFGPTADTHGDYGGGGGSLGDADYGGGPAWATGGLLGLAQGGTSHLGDYSDGGRLLKGPGDGVSDSIPATIGDKRPARLADGEFVVPARIVSELGNGSTEAGARKLYAMMDRIQQARGKTTGKGRVAVNSRAEKALPA